jgi:1,4-dihydroxy-2-naphthoate octaprenyltransferase
LIPAGWQLFRPAFLATTLLSLLAGTAAALHAGIPVVWGYLPWIVLAACAAHASVNALNDYEDFRSGLDLLTKKTSFSGGSGFLVAHPEKAPTALWLAGASLALTILIGMYLTYARGYLVLMIGLIGVALIIGYTRLLTRYPLLCFMAPGLGCGVCMVLGTEYVLAGALSTCGWFMAAIFFLLYNNLLLLNQFPDIQADSKVGRRHYPIVLGKKKSLLLYAVGGSLAVFLLVVGVGNGSFPLAALTALPPSLGYIGVFYSLSKDMQNWERLVHALRLNTIHISSTALILSAAILLTSLNG